MVDAVKKPKQMAAYDHIELDVDGHVQQEDETYDEDGEEIHEVPLEDLRSCQYCCTELLKVENEITREDDDEISHREYCLWYCRNCRFWQARLYSDPGGGCLPGPIHLACISKLREFDGNLPEGCSQELALFIRSRPAIVHSFDPKQFEKIVADVFRANYGNAEVSHVGGPNDGGVDVVLIDSEMGEWLIQVKRRQSPYRSEGVDTVRNLLGAMIVEGVRRGVVVSTADRFSKPAQRAAGKAQQNEMWVRLVDNGIFNKMLDPILPDRPFLPAVRQLDGELATHLENLISSDNQLDLFGTAPPLLLR